MPTDLVTSGLCDTSCDTDALLLRQFEREEAQRASGIARFTKQFEEAQQAGRGEDTEPGIYLMKRAIEPVAEGIQKFIADAYAGKPGPKATAAVALKDLDPFLAAYCTVSKVVGAVAATRSRHLSSIASAVSRDIELELKMAAFDQQKPGLYHTIMRRLEEQRSTDIHIARVITHTATKYGLDWTGWTANERLHIGGALIDICLNATGIATIKTVSIGGGKWAAVLEPTPFIVEWVEQRRTQLAETRPFLLPMLVTPRRWSRVFGGGYRSDQIMRTTLVKRVSKVQRDAVQEAIAAGRMTTAITAINAVQDTGWRINGGVLSVAQRLWERGGDMPGLPSRDAEEEPPRPPELGEKPQKGHPKPELTDAQKEVLREWKWAARGTVERNLASRSKRVATDLILKTGSDLVGERAIYFPHQLDFRGRMYCRTTGLNPQGEDLTKGLLTFANGKPLGSEAAVRWLAIHGANSFGVDKVSHDARVDWVRDNSAQIEEVAFDPLGTAGWWQQADAPWSFLAFCNEWGGFLKEGRGYVSSVPIALDGSCNGIQHYSAMLRDPVGGAAVNLTPSDVPQDIYGRVADEALRRLAEIAADPEDENAWVAQGWIAFGLDRKMTKRQVMVLPYGGTQSSCREYTFEAVREKIAAGTENPFGNELEKRAIWLASIIWKSIGNVVIAAREAMDWLRKVARVAANAGVPLRWTTPSGFVAFQDYRMTKERRIKTRVGGQLIYFTHNEDTKKIDPNRQSSGSPPNFVHSMDGAALALTVERSAAAGVSSFAMIHDSYGTVAADTDTLARCLRDAFVDMYSNEDILAKYRDEIAAQLPEGVVLPELPVKGSLDLELVRTSPYFFT